jgi:hypothetical protein
MHWEPNMDPLSQGLSLQFVTRLADDAADQAAFISGWEQDYAQISCGRFPGGWMSCVWDACRCSANTRPVKPTSNASPGAVPSGLAFRPRQW